MKKSGTSFGAQLSLMLKNSWAFICDTFKAPLSAVHTNKIRWQEALFFSFVQMVFYMFFSCAFFSPSTRNILNLILFILIAGLLSLVGQALLAVVIMVIKCILTKKPAKELWLSSYTESIQSGLFMTCAVLLSTIITLFAPNQFTILPVFFAIIAQILILRNILLEKYSIPEDKLFYVLSGFYLLQGLVIAILYTILVQSWSALFGYGSFLQFFN
jgi:hypothetical protein